MTKITIVNNKLIKDFIAKRKLTKAQFAKMCNISISTLNRILKAKATVTKETLNKISKVI